MREETMLRIMRRDGFKCRYCDYDGGKSYDAWRHGGMCVDHLKPVRWGGTDEDDNLMTTCHSCNSYKAGHDLGTSVEDVRRWLRLYRRMFSRVWYEAYVTQTAADNRPRSFKELQQRFENNEDEPDA